MHEVLIVVSHLARLHSHHFLITDGEELKINGLEWDSITQCSQSFNKIDRLVQKLTQQDTPTHTHTHTYTHDIMLSHKAIIFTFKKGNYDKSGI
jgi:hypothetical protein